MILSIQNTLVGTPRRSRGSEVAEATYRIESHLIRAILSPSEYQEVSLYIPRGIERQAEYHVA